MSNLKTNLRATFDLAQEYLEGLCKLLDIWQPRQTHYFELPTPLSHEETKTKEHIEVKHHENDIALTHIKSAFTDFFKVGDQSGKVMKRHPGVVWLPKEAFVQFEPYLLKINELKSQFKNTVLSLDNSDARFDLVHSAVPGLITLAFYRQLHFEANNPYSIRYTWMTKHSTKSLTRKLALTMLERSSAYSNPRMIDQTSWQQLVEQEKRKVASLSENEMLRIRRPIKVTPEVNVRFADNRRYHVSGALPFLVFDDNPDLKLGLLANYQPKDDPRKQEHEYLVERLYLAKGV
ncbi:DNA replication terminus site-binding protein [Pseudoalteromonas sp. SSDWG2]|uniref:DNA replication terminus site-binding protein n=1 Tax=Pseudoalteromonas sp. SSDWG2 TaxID=3139391 RepID=UPI003BA8658B